MSCIQISRYTSRLYTDLGADLWIIKLKSDISSILSKGATYCQDQGASLECIEALTKLKNLMEISWSRQAQDMNLFPDSEMLRIVDKKFAGNLTKVNTITESYVSLLFVNSKDTNPSVCNLCLLVVFFVTS